MNRATKTGRDPKGKGVEALFEQEQAAKAAGVETKAERDARKKREKRKEQREAAAKFNASVSLTGAGWSSAAPALAKAFDEACAVTEWRQAELDAAVREQAKAKQALDQAIARRANGERA